MDTTGIIPSSDSVSINPVKAEELCITAVKAIPIRISRKGEPISEKKDTKPGEFFKSMAPALITSKAMKINPTPLRTFPIFFNFSFLALMTSKAPGNTEKAKISAIGRLLKDRITAVTVVPILAPMIIQVA